jgi:hypothetical protein
LRNNFPQSSTVKAFVDIEGSQNVDTENVRFQNHVIRILYGFSLLNYTKRKLIIFSKMSHNEDLPLKYNANKSLEGVLNHMNQKTEKIFFCGQN